MTAPLNPPETLAANIALTVVGGGLLALASWWLLRCPHSHEIFDRYPDGRPALRCPNCLQIRPNILGQPQPQYHLTQHAEPKPSFATGIERVIHELDFPITDADLFNLPARQRVAQRLTKA